MVRYARTLDWITLLFLVCLCSFGLFLLLTINTALFWQQLLFVSVAVFLLFLFSRIDAAILWWMAPVGYVLGNIFLLLSYLGPSVRGATRWIMVAGIQLQPSELSKPFFLLAFSYFITKFSPRKIQHLPIHIVLFCIPFFIVFKQPDLGTSIVYASTWLSMMLAGGLPVILIILAGGVGVLAVPAIWSHLLPYQQQRIHTFLSPTLDPTGAGYNALQAMIAVGSGQWFGRGLGRGTQSHLRFLPEHHTDFIFATLIEEFGFVGGALLLFLYLCLLVRIIVPLLHQSKSAGVFVYSVGLFSMLLTQVFINAAMNMGLVPITGITLPFVSYGGSSLLSFGIAFGFLWSLVREKSSDTLIAIGRPN